MRYALILLIASTLLGQDIKVEMDVAEVQESLFETRIVISLSDSSFRVLLTHVLKDYLEECYADSSKAHVHDAKWNDGCFILKGDRIAGYYWELNCSNKKHFAYTHKEPTLQGFIKWLEK